MVNKFELGRACARRHRLCWSGATNGTHICSYASNFPTQPPVGSGRFHPPSQRCSAVSSELTASHTPTSPSSPSTSQLPAARLTNPSVGGGGSGGSGAAPLHYAVVGAGLAGLATAWQLLRHAPRDRPVILHLYDAAGIAAGGSGAAAGLLHPYSPRGKLLWQGEEAMAAALELVAAAEAVLVGAAVEGAAATPQSTSDRLGDSSSSSGAGGGEGGPGGRGGRAAGPSPQQFVWRCGLVRPAANVRQAADFVRLTGGAGSGVGGDGEPTSSGGERGDQGRHSPRVLSAAELQALVPGLVLPRERPPPREGAGERGVEGMVSSDGGEGAGAGVSRGPNRRSRRAAAAASRGRGDMETHAGLLIPQGLVLDVGSYLRSLWEACKAHAAARGDGSCARLLLRRVHSLAGLKWRAVGDGGGEGVYDAVVVAAGAAAATIEEVRAAALPLQLCQGLTLVMHPPITSTTAPSPSFPPGSQHPPATPRPAPCYPPSAPSLLGAPYLAAQGPHRLVVGATKSYGMTGEGALEACYRSEYAEGGKGRGGGPGGLAGREAEEVAELRTAAEGVWSPLLDWRLTAVREGVRALPPRTSHGSLPLLGRLAAGRPWWLVGGLGSRGLVYHGWLGALTAEAVRQDSEAGMPYELTAWRGVAAGAEVFEAP